VRRFFVFFFLRPKGLFVCGARGPGRVARGTCYLIPHPTTALADLSIAGYLKTLVLDNRTAYHGYFEFLRLETGFEQLSGGCTVLERGAATKRNGLIFIRWTHIDLGAQDFNGIQRPKSKLEVKFLTSTTTPT
jgi:hypothetical protein